MTSPRLASLLRHRTARDAVVRTARDAARAVAAELWLVGGYVRDAALRRRSSDVDLIVGRRAGRLIGELRSRWSTGGFRFRKRGVTTWRFAVGGQEVDMVDASRRGLPADLARRDFTVNAVAFDLGAGRLCDPLDGLADLRAGRLRMPRRDAMREDPLRALRAARFLAQLPAFRLDRAARRAAGRAGAGLRRSAPERLRIELEKLLGADEAERGLQALDELGLLEAVLPGLAPLRECRAGAGRPDVWRHTLDAIRLSRRPLRLPRARLRADGDGRRLLRWALLLHDISKPETLAVRADGRPTFHGHEVIGAGRADELLRRLRLPRAQRRRICRLILQHLRPSQLAEAGSPERGVRRLAREAGEDLPLLVLHAACDARASGSPDAARRWRRLRRLLSTLTDVWQRRRAISLPRLVDGRDVMRTLGLEPGRRVGDLLERLGELQLAGEIETRAQALDWLRDRAGGR